MYVSDFDGIEKRRGKNCSPTCSRKEEDQELEGGTPQPRRKNKDDQFRILRPGDLH